MKNNKPVKNKMTKERKAVIVIEKERRAIGFEFKNEEMNCTCLSGKCPNYDSRICGKGGRAVYRQVSRKITRRKLKRMLYRDMNVSPWGK